MHRPARNLCVAGWRRVWYLIDKCKGDWSEDESNHLPGLPMTDGEAKHTPYAVRRNIKLHV